ncbi:MAG: glycoside hydrolase family 2 TIM barrel-domain containing protein, partial [Chitinophagaceae bacterium]
FTIDAMEGVINLQQNFQGIKTWNPESPDLYQLTLTVSRSGKPVHTITKKFGFRTAELHPGEGFFVNGVKVIFKGVDRHSFWPESGRTLSKAISIMDVSLMKEMNMNAVRMSHYPPDQHFLDVCDSMGMFVLDELTGWQAAYDTVAGRKLVRELVERDVNHPSIVMWANGNEGGFNRGLDNDYKIYDIQGRIVYHPWEKFNGTDTKHYPDYSYLVNSALYSQEIFFPTEFMHGLYDGGHAAGLSDFWDKIINTPTDAGGFLWDFSDAGLVRTDRNGVLDTDGNHGADGILGPHREKEASYYGIKEIWSPVYVAQKTIPADFDGRLLIENRYLYTNLDQCRFSWKLVSFPGPGRTTVAYSTESEGNCAPFKLAPGERSYLSLKIPQYWMNSDALYLTATDQYGKEIFTWTWPISSPKKINSRFLPSRPNGAAVTATETGDQLVIKNGKVDCYFTKSTGFLDKVMSDAVQISLSGGPFMLSTALTLKSFTHHAEGNNQVIEASYTGTGSMKATWTFSPGMPAKLSYNYTLRGEADFIGIGMNYPEEKITGIKWLGRGPYRVWKNRMQGMQFGVFQKNYNNTVTGESWVYPEFKGYHANLNWVVIGNKEKPFTIYCENEGSFLQLLKPAKPRDASNDNTSPPFPTSSLGFMYAIPPIGTKFQGAERLGPGSQKNAQLNNGGISGTLWFEF